ncbi:MAG: hypothetical protein AB8B56_09765 [Crocinitomicaceae bacterium]
MRYFMILSAMLLIFSACKEDEPVVDLCANGFLDPGETAPDCGGDCPPCAAAPIPFLTLLVDGVSTSMSNQELDYDGNSWSLQMSNDSLNIQIGYGTAGVVGTFPIDPAASFLYKDGTEYSGQTDGTFSISEHNTADDLMSGFFQIKFFRPGFVDTLEISSGQFGNFSY